MRSGEDVPEEKVAFWTDKVEQAAKLIGNSLRELDGIVKAVSQGGDVEIGWSRFRRWKARTIKGLSERISGDEAKMLEQASGFVRMDGPLANFKREIKANYTVLQTFLEDLPKHPEHYFPFPGGDDLPEKTATGGPLPIQDAIWAFIHPAIERLVKDKFHDKYYSEAVEAALKGINERVKNHVKDKLRKDCDGTKLMEFAFSERHPVIQLSDLSTESGKNIQKGYARIFAGAMLGIRNPAAHANIVMEESEALHLLFLASLLMFKLDEAGVHIAAKQSNKKDG